MSKEQFVSLSGLPADGLMLRFLPIHKNGIILRVDEMDAGAYLFVKDVNIIEEKYMEQNLSLVSVSNEIAVSPNYLSSLIKKSTGSTFVDLLTKKRIMVAKELLLYSNLKIREIAEKCGYSDQHYFSYCFKKYTGMSPNACRRMETGENKQDE